jgi:hypothetical protein
MAGSLGQANEVAPFQQNGRPSPCQPLCVFTTQTLPLPELWRGVKTLTERIRELALHCRSDGLGPEKDQSPPKAGKAGFVTLMVKSGT